MVRDTSGIERFEITTGGGHDQVTTGDISDAMFVGSGNNTVHSGGGDDSVGHLISGTNILDGGGGRDTLTGGGDTLNGGAGADRFVFIAGETVYDELEDFEAGLDQLSIAAGITGGVLGAGAVNPAYFALELAVGTTGQFVYRTDTSAGVTDGLLLWDANGETAGGETTIALLYDMPALTAADLFIFV